MGREGYAPLFETKPGNGRMIYRMFAASVLAAICMVCYYRATQKPWKEEDDPKINWAWMTLFGCEIWFGIYWIATQGPRWSRVYRSTFKDRLIKRYSTDDLPSFDLFVCTADPIIEPPLMVINTVLSLMSYDYPPEKLSVYLSDDGGSELTFYAMLEASKFSKYWLPYCRKYSIEPRCPAAYFNSTPIPVGAAHDEDLASIKKLYEEMENRIETSTKLGRVPNEARAQHKGFSQWNSNSTRGDHDAIVQILIDGRIPDAKDVEGRRLPTLVYLSREKRPQHFHHYKAGAMNALIRVSSNITNAPIILNVDCDMYSSSSESLWDALCFFMDEKQNQQIGYVQFPQNFKNLTKNEIYGGLLRVTAEWEFHGFDGLDGPMYIGSCCFHRRDILCGRKYSKDSVVEWKAQSERVEGTVQELEQKAKELASCTCEYNSQWGKEMGVRYGFAVEDIATGLSIQCNGWKSVYYNPKRVAFLGLPPTTLTQILVQRIRWSGGDFHVLLSRYCPFWRGHKKISLLQQLAYCNYLLWPCNALPSLIYCIVPSLYLFGGISLFPEVCSKWFLPYAYIAISTYSYSLLEYLWCQGNILGWWNEQRVWLYKRTSSDLFAFIDTLLMLIGRSNLKFEITAKVTDDDSSKRYENEILEFGNTSPLFIIVSTIALTNLFCLVVGLSRVVLHGGQKMLWERMGFQIMLCIALVLINLPLYEALFLRKDKGKMPSEVTMKAVGFALLGCSCSSFLLTT
ncbi:glycosyltransferase 2 [Ancistrocladus abbreviatus]